MHRYRNRRRRLPNATVAETQQLSSCSGPEPSYGHSGNGIEIVELDDQPLLTSTSQRALQPTRATPSVPALPWTGNRQMPPHAYYRTPGLNRNSLTAVVLPTIPQSFQMAPPEQLSTLRTPISNSDIVSPRLPTILIHIGQHLVEALIDTSCTYSMISPTLASKFPPDQVESVDLTAAAVNGQTICFKIRVALELIFGAIASDHWM